jgi:hypothetical protein
MKNKDLPITEDLDFSYLLGLMRPLHKIDNFAWLPELFTLIGHEKLIDLCRYAGGETITIPTLEELSSSIDSLQDFYDVYIKKSKTLDEVDQSNFELVGRIKEIYDARNS